MLNMTEKYLEEDTDSGFVDDFTTYQYINEAAVEFVRRTECLTTSEDITTVADQAAYTLSPDFMSLYMRDSRDRFFVKINDGTNNYFSTWKHYEDIILADQSSDSITIPSHFTIRNKTTRADQITGNTTSAGTASGGVCTLADSGGGLSSADVADIVHNTNDGSRGVVVSETSDTALVTALFNGTDNDWSNNDAYVIQPQARYEIVFDPPPSTADYTVTVYYIQRPAPVFSDYYIFDFPPQYTSALCKYAAWLYKYRDEKPARGDRWYTAFERAIRQYGDEINKVRRRRNFRVSFKKIS